VLADSLQSAFGSVGREVGNLRLERTYGIAGGIDDVATKLLDRLLARTDRLGKSAGIRVQTHTDEGVGVFPRGMETW
jgi:hypothetical protein